MGKGRRKKNHSKVSKRDEESSKSHRKNGGKQQPSGKSSNNSGSRKKQKKKNYDIISDLTGSDAKFRHNIENDGTKTIIEMSADGNCLFRSLSDQLYWDYGNKHEDIRSEVCDFMEAHEEEFSVFLVLNDEDEDASDFESYIFSMRESGEWGGNLELVAAARLYRRKVKVFSITAAYTIDHDKNSSGPDLMVSYHDNDHYNSVRGKNGNKSLQPEYLTKTTVVLTEEAEGISANLQSIGHEGENQDTKNDSLKQQQEETHTSSVEKDGETILTEGRQKKQNPGGPCASSSGKSYRKRCSPIDKRKVTKARGKFIVSIDNTPEEDVTEIRELPPSTYDMENGFKLLEI